MCLWIIFLISGCSYPTLEEAIQHESKTSIKILTVDEKNSTVIYLQSASGQDRSNDQYVFTTFEKEDSKYSYYIDDEDSSRFDSAKGLVPFLTKVMNSKKAGTVVWGALKTDKQASRIEITLSNRQNPKQEIKMTTHAKNNAFVAYTGQRFFESPAQISMIWKISAKALDNEGKVIATTEQ